MFQKSGRRYRLVKMGLLRMALPQAVASLTCNSHPAYPVVAERNRKKFGHVAATGYTPHAVVTAGAMRRAKYLAAGVVKTWILAEADLEIQADDEIGCSELLERLRSAVTLRICGREGGSTMPGQDWPVMQEVYPFENCLIYAHAGGRYRQHFALDPVARVVHLVNGATQVFETFMEAGTESMPRVQTGVHYAFAPPRSDPQTTTRGALRSELVTCVVRNWKNIREAADAYVAAVRTGLRKPMTPAFAPVRLTGDGRIDAALKAAGVTDLYDFAVWSAQMQDAQRITRKIQ